MAATNNRAALRTATEPAIRQTWRRDAAACGERRSVAGVTAAIILALAPAAAKAHPEELVVLGLGFALVPAAGTEIQFREGHTRTERLLLSWPLQIPLDPGDDSAASKDPVLRLWSVHRLVVEPELRLVGNTEVGGRVGYRFTAPAFFAGLGATYSNSLGVSAAPELGVRWFTRDAITGWFLVARADVPITSHFGERWAASLSLGLLLY